MFLPYSRIERLCLTAHLGIKPVKGTPINSRMYIATGLYLGLLCKQITKIQKYRMWVIESLLDLLKQIHYTKCMQTPLVAAQGKGPF